MFARRTLPLDVSAAMLAGEIYARLDRTEDRIGVQDALIAGICRRIDLPLATRNARHFRRVRGLGLVEVPVQS
jgi:tRNA(fMet)-specific endonuclease VapC